MPPKKILPNVCEKCRTDKKTCTISNVKNPYSCGECIAAKRVCSLTVDRHLALVNEKKRKASNPPTPASASNSIGSLPVVITQAKRPRGRPRKVQTQPEDHANDFKLAQNSTRQIPNQRTLASSYNKSQAQSGLIQLEVEDDSPGAADTASDSELGSSGSDTENTQASTGNSDSRSGIESKLKIFETMINQQVWKHYY